MNEAKPPRIEFPCHYVIKVIGESAPDFRDFVVAVVEQHAPGLQEADISVTESRHGRFSSVQLRIMATGEDQLQALFAELKASGRVHMVL